MAIARSILSDIRIYLCLPTSHFLQNSNFQHRSKDISHFVTLHVAALCVYGFNGGTKTSKAFLKGFGIREREENYLWSVEVGVRGGYMKIYNSCVHTL